MWSRLAVAAVPAAIGVLGLVWQGIIIADAKHDRERMEATIESLRKEIEAAKANPDQDLAGSNEYKSEMAELQEQLSRAESELKNVRTNAGDNENSSRLSGDPVQPAVASTEAAESNTSKTLMERLAPFDVVLQKCEYSGGGLSCSLLIENTRTEPAYLALESSGTVMYVDGSECPLRQASLGSRKWSADKFGAIRVEERIPLMAKLQFTGVPDTARNGSLRLVLGVAQTTGAQAFYGPGPEWKSLMFRDVPFQ